MSNSEITLRSVVLLLEQGLHIRVCSKVVSLVSGFPGSVQIRNGDKVADAASMFDLLQLVALPGHELQIEANGDGSSVMAEQLAALFSGELPY